jgi:uncharacterized protein (TIGR02444 family)
MIDFPHHDFWDFSIRIYGRDGVAEACLGLQERHGADVNVVLFGLWLAASGRGALVEAELGQALSAVEAWHDRAVRHLRALRRWLKGDLGPASGGPASGGPAPGELGDQLRKAVASLEIDAEHIEQLMLAGALARAPEQGLEAAVRAGHAAASLAAYLAAIAADPSDADRAAAALLLGAAFPQVAAAELARLARLEGLDG